MGPATATARIFVTGTDTGVGKTVVTGGLLRALAQRGLRVAGMKPIATGARRCGATLVNDDAEMLRDCSNVPLARELVCPCVYAAPTAPHLAAAAAGERIDLERIAAAYAALRARADAVLVEGIGGWALPLAETTMLAELPRRLGLAVVLIVGVRLGALNHALLSARAIVDDGLPLVGWIANTVVPDYAWADGTVETLTAHLPGPLLGRIPYQAAPTPASVAPYLADAAAHLVAPGAS